MAGELDAIKARLSERNVSDKEIGQLVATAAGASVDTAALAEVLKMAYDKMGNKEIVPNQPTTELKAEARTPESALTAARALLAKKKELVPADDEGKKGSVTKRLKRVKDKPAAEQAADKAAAKAEKATAKEAKKKKKEKKSVKEVVKTEKKVVDKSAKNDKDLAKLTEKKKGKKKDEKGQDGKTTQGQEMGKLEKPDLSKYGIKEVGKDYVMSVTDEKGVKVDVNVTTEVNQLKGICSKIDDANKMIEQHNQINGKPNIAIDPMTAVAGKDVNAPAVTEPAVAIVDPAIADAVKKEACSAALAGIKAPDGITPKFSEEEIKRLSEAALALAKGDKLTKGLDEKKKEEEKTDHGEKPNSLAIPTQVISR